MYQVQRVRAARLADRLAAASGPAGGILIAANGHVRRDRRMPWYLVHLRPAARALSIAPLEVWDDRRRPRPICPTTTSGSRRACATAATRAARINTTCDVSGDRLRSVRPADPIVSMARRTPRLAHIFCSLKPA